MTGDVNDNKNEKLQFLLRLIKPTGAAKKMIVVTASMCLLSLGLLRRERRVTAVTLRTGETDVDQHLLLFLPLRPPPSHPQQPSHPPPLLFLHLHPQ